MIDPQITRRFVGEAQFQEEKLRNLFRTAFQDEGRAWEVWRKTAETRGVKHALTRLTDRPTRFGKLKGKAHLGFLKNKAFEDREHALKNVGVQADRWGAAQMQLEQHEARKRDVGAARDAPSKIERDTLEQTQERDR
jgi:phosphoglycolate phosphatase-like HAD superfamily hydrolase